MSDTVLDRWFAMERAKYGRADYFFKENCLSSKILAFYVRPFNPTYLYRFTTTRYPNTYFPGRKKGNEKSMLRTEFHENVHKFDRWSEGFSFTLKYLFPQWVALPFVLAVVVLGGLWSWLAFGALLAALHIGLAVLAGSASKAGPDDGYAGAIPSRGARTAFFVLTGVATLNLLLWTILGGGWFALLWLGAALFASPWPIKAFWRRDYEIRGYTATLYRIWLEYGQIWVGAVADLVENFTGSNYFWMEPSGEAVEKELTFQVSLFMSTGIENGEAVFLERWNNEWLAKPGGRDRKKMAEPFRMIKEFVEKEKLFNASA
jgi:hypothetical protein